MIRRYIEDSTSFDAEQTAAIASAFDQVCQALGLDGNARGREIVAVRIIELARTGVIDAAALRDRVLQEGRNQF